MTTFHVITRPIDLSKRPKVAEDDIESELHFSTREAGVNCFPLPGDDDDEDADD